MPSPFIKIRLFLYCLFLILVPFFAEGKTFSNENESSISAIINKNDAATPFPSHNQRRFGSMPLPASLEEIGNKIEEEEKAIILKKQRNFASSESFPAQKREKTQKRRFSSVGKWLVQKLEVIRRILKSPKQMERVLKILMYLSRVDPEGEPVIVGMETLRGIGRENFMVEKLMEYSMKEIGMDELEQLGGEMLVKFSADGISPIYMGGEKPNEWGTYEDDELEERMGLEKKEILRPKETEEVLILLDEIVKAVRENEREQFHSVFEDCLNRLDRIKWLNKGMEDRVANWKAKWATIKGGIERKSVGEGWKDVAIWLFSPFHLEQMLEVVLYFTNLSSALELPRSALAILGVDDLIGDWMERMGQKMEVKWGKRSRTARIVAKYLFRENGVPYLFLHQGQMAERKEKVRLSEEEALGLLKKVAESVVEQRGKSKGKMVEKALFKLREWNHKFVEKARKGWERVKSMDMELFKGDLKRLGGKFREWITPDRAYELVRLIFGLTKLDGPITIASIVIQVLGLHHKIFDWLDEKAIDFLSSNRLNGKLELKQFLVRFMVGDCKLGPKNKKGISKGIEGRILELEGHKGADEGEGEKEKPQPMLVLYKSECAPRPQGLLKQIVENGGGRAWAVMEDLGWGYRLLKTAIQTMHSNPEWQLDKLVKVSHRRSRMVEAHAEFGNIMASCFWFGCLPVSREVWRKMKKDWSRIELEELRRREHISDFLRQQKQWKKAIEEKRGREKRKRTLGEMVEEEYAEERENEGEKEEEGRGLMGEGK